MFFHHLSITSSRSLLTCPLLGEAIHGTYLIVCLLLLEDKLLDARTHYWVSSTLVPSPGMSLMNNQVWSSLLKASVWWLYRLATKFLLNHGNRLVPQYFIDITELTVVEPEFGCSKLSLSGKFFSPKNSLGKGALWTPKPLQKSTKSTGLGDS